MMGNSITFLGGGSFGTALSIMMAKKGFNVFVWDRSHETIDNINNKRENINYLPGVVVPHNVYATLNLEEALEKSKYIVLSVPSQAIREVASKIRPYLKKDSIIISIAKGIDENTGERLSEVIRDEISDNGIVILSGPSHAEEVALDIPTTVVASSEDMSYAKEIQNVFMTNKFRVYTNSDLIGVEIGGAVKNIIALAAGISDGIGYGDNTKAALMTRGMSEIIRIGEKLGGKAETFSGLTGFGDLIVTCTSMHSRNRRAGILIGKGVSPDEAVKEIGMVVEGIKACKAFYNLKEKLDVSMPITDVLYKVVFEEKDPKYAVYELMSRDKKEEF